MHGEQASESQEKGANCNNAPCNHFALSLGSTISKSTQKKELTLICYSTTVDLFCLFGLSKKLLLNLFTEQGYYYLLPDSRVVSIK